MSEKPKLMAGIHSKEKKKKGVRFFKRNVRSMVFPKPFKEEKETENEKEYISISNTCRIK